MKTCQVLDENENIVDNKQKYDKLLSRSEANQYELDRIKGAGLEQSLYATAAQGDQHEPPAAN